MQSAVASLTFEILVKKVAICIVSDFAGALNMVLANELGNRLKLSPLESWPLKIHDRDAPENFPSNVQNDGKKNWQYK